MTPDELSERLLGFAVGTLRLVPSIKKHPAGGNVGRQLEKAATAGGANYEEGRSAESRADFVHKVSIALKEMRESLYWLRIAEQAELASREELDPLLGEATELVAILAASVRTATSRARS